MYSIIIALDNELAHFCLDNGVRLGSRPPANYGKTLEQKPWNDLLLFCTLKSLLVNIFYQFYVFYQGLKNCFDKVKIIPDRQS